MLIFAWSSPAMAQQYGFDANCRPLPPPGYMVQPQPASQECLRDRAAVAAKEAAAQREEDRQRQLQEDQQRQAEAAATAARQAALTAISEAEARAEMVATMRIKAIAEAKIAAENSPDNLCRKQSVAKMLMQQYDSLFEDAYVKRKVIDMHHIVTLKSDADTGMLVCHAIWIHARGEPVEGTMTIRPNAAGEMITNWQAERWEPAVVVPNLPPPAAVAVQAPSVPSPAQAPVAAPGTSPFKEGLAERGAWETWTANLTGDAKAGALFWAAQRSLPHPSPCSTLAGEMQSGCLQALARLSSTDVKRKTDPDYRRGWNSYQ
jgi:hypothetical protein